MCILIALCGYFPSYQLTALYRLGGTIRGYFPSYRLWSISYYLYRRHDIKKPPSLWLNGSQFYFKLIL